MLSPKTDGNCSIGAAALVVPISSAARARSEAVIRTRLMAPTATLSLIHRAMNEVDVDLPLRREAGERAGQRWCFLEPNEEGFSVKAFSLPSPVAARHPLPALARGEREIIPASTEDTRRIKAKYVRVV